MASDPVKLQMTWLEYFMRSEGGWFWDTVDRKTDTHFVHPEIDGNCYLVRFYGEKHDKARVVWIGGYSVLRHYSTKEGYFDKFLKKLDGPKAKDHDCRKELRAHLRKQMRELESL